jgi:hypothetical protein
MYQFYFFAVVRPFTHPTRKFFSLSFRNRYLKELCLVHRELVRCVTTVEFQAGIVQGLHQ